MITMKDIAKEAGVSVQTVSRILNGENKEVWPSSIRRAEKIRAIAQRINFRPSANARTMRSSKTRMIGVLIRNSTDIPYTAPTNYEIILGIYHQLEHAGYEMCLVHQSDVGQRSRIFHERMLDGLIVLGDIQPQMQSEIRKTFPQCVWVDVNVNEPKNCIWRDEFASGQLVGNQLIEAGYRDVIWICRDPEDAVAHYSHTQRLAGLRDAMNKVDGPTEVCCRFADDQTVKELDGILAQLTPRTAVVAYNAALAMAVINWAISKRLMPGRDFSLVCPDDSLSFHEMDSVLSRVHFDRLKMGQLAAGLLLNQMSSKPSPSFTMPVKWIEGSTLCRCPSG